MSTKTTQLLKHTLQKCQKVTKLCETGIPLWESPLVAAVNAPRSSSMPENLRFSSPTRCREPLLSARSSTLCTVLFTVHSIPIYVHILCNNHTIYDYIDRPTDRPTHTHTHSRSAGTRKVKPIWILLKQKTVSGSDISWDICKSAPRSRQITTPVPHHSVFTGRMPFLPPNQQRQSTEGNIHLAFIL